MADFSSFTTKFRTQKIGSSDPPAKRVIKRARLVCNQCHRSKLKCDLCLPCKNCTKRNDGTICSYQRSMESKSDSSRGMLAEERLSHLESMISQLMEKQAPSQSDSRETSNNFDPSLEVVSVQPTMNVDRRIEHSNSYVGGTHWSAILDDLQDLRLLLGDETGGERGVPTITPSLDSTARGDLIFGLSNSYTLQEIISVHLPPKVEMDRLIARYFQSEVYIVPFIHSYQFQQQYQQFWKDVASVHPLWLSLLFSICCMSTKIGESVELSQKPHGDLYMHTAAGQCLVLGEYHRPQKLAVEALALYAHCKTFRSLDPSREAGAILSIVVRMAFELGYHRDPDSFGSFSVFDGEMRRRFWAAIKQMDMMLSFQLGLPSSINAENCDTKSPRNLLDSDFNPETRVLPLSRPDEEATKLLWFIVKERQMNVFSKVCRNALSFTEKSETEISQLDQEVQEMFTTIPDSLRTRPLCDSIVDPPFLIMTRLYVEFIYLKSLCVLHRKYMARGNLVSTKACVYAGSRLVSQFLDMYKEFGPGGQLFPGRWMLNSFNMDDFLLGLMVLCSVVHTYWKDKSRHATIDTATESEILGLLEKALVICAEKSAESRDAEKVSRVVLLTLNIFTSKKDQESAVLPSIDGREFLLPPWHSYMQVIDDPLYFVDNDLENMDWSAFEPNTSLTL